MSGGDGSRVRLPHQPRDLAFLRGEVLQQCREALPPQTLQLSVILRIVGDRERSAREKVAAMEQVLLDHQNGEGVAGEELMGEAERQQWQHVIDKLHAHITRMRALREAVNTVLDEDELARRQGLL